MFSPSPIHCVVLQNSITFKGCESFMNMVPVLCKLTNEYGFQLASNKKYFEKVIQFALIFVFKKRQIEEGELCNSP